METAAPAPKRKIQIPHVYTIAFSLIVIFAILTWIIPSGEFDRVAKSTAAGERMVAVAGTFKAISKIDPDGNDLRQGVTAVLMAPTRGIQAAADVVAFVLLIGGTFQIITMTNAINVGMGKVVKRLKNKDILIFPIVLTLFSIGGTTFGMSEETLPFYAIFMPIMLGLGYDSMTTFLLCFMGAQIGYSASTLNPFNVLISQGIAGIHGNPQLAFRAVQWLILTVITVIWVMRYAARIKRTPELSITYRDDIEKRRHFGVGDRSVDEAFTWKHKLVLLIFAGGMAVIVWGLVYNGWYMDEISMVFLAIGLLAGLIGGLGEKNMAEAFVDGMKDFVYAAAIIGVARGILVVSTDGKIIDPILNYLATMLSGVPTPIFTTMMYVVQSLLTFLIPSSSGLASLTIPVMAPLTDLMQVNPEASVTCLQYANQLTNMISPTAGMTVAGLAVCRISFVQWWKTCWKFFLVVTILGIAFTAISGMMPQ